MKKIIYLLFSVGIFTTSCQKEKVESDASTVSNEAKINTDLLSSKPSTPHSSKAFMKSGTPKEKYLKSLQKFRTKIKVLKAGKNNRYYEETNDVITTDENPIEYTTGGYVGDPNDDVIAADGYVVMAANTEEETQARQALSEQINEAKSYLNFHGLDLSDEYGYDDPRYIHAANIITELEETRGIPGTSLTAVRQSYRENSTLGCAMQAIGITSLYDAWFDKFSTKRMLITAVGKVAARYLGFVGAALAVADFIDCMWG